MESNVTRDSVLALILEKEKIETEISQMKSVLDGVSSVVTLFDISWCWCTEWASNSCSGMLYWSYVRNDVVPLTGSQ